jgi:hypothetical protein
VQQIHHSRHEELRVSVDRQRWVNGLDAELNVPVLGLQQPRRGDLVDECDHRHTGASLFANFEADFGQRAVDDFAKTHQTLSENGSSAAVDGDGASLECVESENRGVQRVSKFVSGVTKTLSLFGRSCLRGQARVFRDRLRNRGVETPVERMEFFYCDGCPLLDRQRRNRLANVGVVMHHLRHREA